MTKDKFPVMLASPFAKIDNIKFPCIAQMKMDGMRAIIVKRDGVVTVYSRNGNVLVGLDKHFEQILIKWDNTVLDGELTVLDDDDRVLDRPTGNGICHKAVQNKKEASISDEEISRIRITLWDITTVACFDAGIDETPYDVRMTALRALDDYGLFSIVNTWEIDDMDHAQEVFIDVVDTGGEGIILKNVDHPWENKRSKHIVKMKEVLEIDLNIIGFAEGMGKNSNMLGALQCENHDGSIRVDVGTGFDDATRIDIWNRQDELLNTIVAIKHNGEITRRDKDVKSLFLPVFVELRVDKEESD